MSIPPNGEPRVRLAALYEDCRNRLVSAADTEANEANAYRIFAINEKLAHWQGEIGVLSNGHNLLTQLDAAGCEPAAQQAPNSSGANPWVQLYNHTRRILDELTRATEAIEFAQSEEYVPPVYILLLSQPLH
jgi:hypothetical protein